MKTEHNFDNNFIKEKKVSYRGNRDDIFTRAAIKVSQQMHFLQILLSR